MREERLERVQEFVARKRPRVVAAQSTKERHSRLLKALGDRRLRRALTSSS